jgi:hypothetical protein
VAFRVAAWGLWCLPAKGLTVYWRASTLLPSTNTSILVRKKQSSAFLRFANDGFILVERGIENHWNVRQLIKRFYQRVKRSVGFL